MPEPRAGASYARPPATPYEEGFTTLYKITDWSRQYENHRTRELKSMDWVPVSNEMDGDGYTELMDHTDGAAHLGAWLAVLKIASRCSPRGVLVRQDGRPHDASTISRISRVPKPTMEVALQRLAEIGWLQTEETSEVGADPAPSRADPAPSRADPAPSRADPAPSRDAARDRAISSVPFPSVPFRSVPGPARAEHEATPTPTSMVRSERFDSFLSVALEVGLSGSARDWDDAREAWSDLTFEDQIAAVRGLALRRQAGEFDDSRFRPLPQNYLGKRIWERAIRPRAAPPNGAGPPEMTKNERVMARIMARTKEIA